jgi:alpha-L-rhamnosidase
MLPAFSDDEWPGAVVKDLPNETVYQPRSIPLLTNVPFTPTVIDTGLLSPGRVVGELGPSTLDPYTFHFEASKPTAFVVEILAGTETSPSGTILLDNNDLEWREAESHRPDVSIASTMVDVGAHSLSFATIPSRGLTFGVSVQDIQPVTLPFRQGVHAGRRLLLAEPVSQPDVVSISSGEGVTVEFTTTPAYVVLDLGRVIHGRLTANVIGPAGFVVDIGWDERLLPGTLRPLPYPGSLYAPWNQTDSWVLDGTLRSISTIDTRAGRYVLIAAWGDAPVQVGQIRVYEERYPVIQRGSFNSSSEFLNEVWQVGVDTLYPNMTDAYTDTPWRERGQWWGDAYVADHINRVALGDTRLLRRGLLFMADAFVDGRPAALAPNSDTTLLLDYGMLWVQSLHDYQQMTKDVQFSAEVYPILCAFMAYLEDHENPSTGLLDIPLGEWWETTLIDWAGTDNRYGQSAAINALYYGTLIDASSIAEATDSLADASIWRQKADRIGEQVNEHLYLPTQHRYAASVFQNEVLSPTIHAQAWPLAYGLVPEQEVEHLVASLLELPPQVQMYGMFWVLEALGRSGHVPEALDIMKAYYGPLLDLGATTWWETTNSEERYASSRSHVWGGGPTWFLTTHVLGARRLGPDTWSVKPALSGVSYASGRLPLADGELQVYWEVKDCENSRVELSAPNTTAGEILIPRTGDTVVVTLDDRVVWQQGMPLMDDVTETAEGISIPLRGGTHTLHIYQDCHTTFMPVVCEQRD